MSRCGHVDHRTDLALYKTAKKEKVKVPIDLGWNPVRFKWETCDAGLFEHPATRKRLRNSKHSNPKKKQETNTEELV